jgi:DNA polymerase III subunit epsilon
MSKFTAIDFETANRSRMNACAIGVVRVENGIIVDKFRSFINPDIEDKYWNPCFMEECHCITPEMVKEAPFFDVVWRSVEPMLEGVDFIAAHNAFSFDRDVLEQCCTRYKLAMPITPFKCSIAQAKECWPLESYALDMVCEHLGIELDHHEPLSDALACAQIIIAAEKLASSKTVALT